MWAVKMDITTLFKACVKTIRTRNKAFGMVITSTENDKNRILNNKKQQTPNSEFIYKAKEVLGQITRLRDFLLEHRKAYLNFASHLSNVPRMSDLERDKIDSGAQRIMKTCSHLILDFKRKSALEDGSPQLLEHHDNILDLIEEYLKTVCKIYSEQKAIRMKRTLETQKLSRLEVEHIKKSDELTIKVCKISSDSNISNKDNYSNSFNNNNIDNNYINTNNSSSSISSSSSTKHNKKHIESEISPFLEDDQLSAEELQMFESENEQLYNELNNLTDEVRQIESKVVKIAELQEIFTEKVLEQERDIERIGTTLIGTTENLKDANQHIRQAIESSASLRVYILFFLLVMAFTLLFLDWYNP
ncbi:syntaxin 18 [Lycorma delicatula]|uniref:syntaxin 18 n=1 Tax=Lycorma delicatula TaxID=130591 RepID=UPI003F517102